MVDRVVRSGEVRLATHDHGGDGPPLLLTHGFGGSRKVLRRMLPWLTPAHRVITFDLRGHGASSTGPWSFDAAVGDVEVVVSAYGLSGPAVAGHSLGGMVALAWGASHPDSMGVVNIDGWGPGAPDRYAGSDPDEVVSFLARASSLEAHPWLARQLIRRTRQSKEGVYAQVMASLDGLDLVEQHAASPCRNLAINATAASTGLQRLLAGRQASALQASYRTGLSRDLALAAARNPLMSVEEIAATHGLIGTHPEHTAMLIRRFLATA